MAKQVVGLFDTMQDAQEAVQDLRNTGFSADDISIVASDAGRGGATTGGDGDEGDTRAGEDAGFGAASGAVMGGLGGLLIGLGALALPGIGPVVAAGSLAAALTGTAVGAGLGAAVGGLVGGLVGMGIPEEDAHVYAEGVRRGGALVTVQAATDEDADRAADILDRHNVVDIDERGANYRAGGWDRFDESAGPHGAGADRAAVGAGAGGGTTADSDRSEWAESSKAGTGGGALAGAATGAAIGSAGGPVGTVIGGAAGAVTGAGVGAAGDAAGEAASDRARGEDDLDTSRSGYTDTADRGTGAAIGSATDYGTTDRGTTDYGTTDTTRTGTVGTTTDYGTADRGTGGADASGGRYVDTTDMGPGAAIRSDTDTSMTDRGTTADYTTTDRSTTDYSATDTTRTGTGVAAGAADYTTTDTSRAGFQTGTRDIDADQGEVAIPVVEEDIRVGTREVDSGGVRVGTRVEETPVEEQVNLREETVRVERRAVDQPVDAGTLPAAFQEGSFEVRERDEEAVVDKQARVVEEVVINKDVNQRTETIQDTVRRTDVDVQDLSGQTRTTDYTDTSRTTGTGVSDVGTTSTSGMAGTSGAATTGGDEGPIERTLGDAKSATERTTGLDLDRSGDVGDRDRRDNF